MAGPDRSYDRMRKRMDSKLHLEKRLANLSKARKHDGHIGSGRNSDVLRSLSGLIPSFVCKMRPNDDLAIIYAGGECERVLGLESTELTNGHSSYASFVHPDDLPDLLREIDRAVEEGGVLSVAHRLLTPSGSVCWVIMHGSVINERGEGQVVHGAIISMDNIQPEEPLTLMDGPIGHHFLEAAFNGLCIVNPELRVTFVNKDMAELIGRGKDSILGENFLDFVEEKSRPLAIAAHNRRRRVRQEKYELSLLHASGEPVRTLVSASVLEEADGSFSGALMMVCDITEHRKAEAALRKGAERFSKVIRAGGFGVAITRLSDGRFLDVNDAFLRTTGFARDEVVGKTTEELGVFQRESRQELVKRVMREGRLDDYEMSMRAKNGDIRHGLFSLSLIGLGGEACILAIGADITERKRVETELKEREKQYRELVESSNSIIVRVDAQSRLLFMNQYAEKFFGYSQEEAIGKKVFETILPERDSSGRDLSAMAQGMLVDPNNYATNVNENIKKNGEKVLVAWTNRPIYDDKGHLKELLAIGNDITERRRAEDALRMSEARFRAIFEGAGIGMGLVNVEGKLVMSNPALQQMLGYDDDELAGSYFKGFVHPKDINLFYGCFEDFASARRERFETECRLTHRGGKVIWGLVTISLVKSADSEPRYTIVMVEDITVRKRAEETLRDSSESMRSLAARLEHVREEERRGIAREIHDELGQTLTALKIDLSWLEKNLSRPIYFQGVSVRNKVADMLDIVDRTMQSVHRISSDLRPGVLDDLGLQAAIEWQLQKFKELTGIEYRLLAGPDTQELGSDIATTVFRIFQESLTNIARHAQASKVNVELMISKNWLILRVSDNGKGITPAESSNPESLGLLGMRERAISLGGSVGFSARKDGGTTVEVRIPLSSEEIEK